MNLYDIDLVTIDGKSQKMGDYRSKTLLIVNVASGGKQGGRESLFAIHFAVRGGLTVLS